MKPGAGTAQWAFSSVEPRTVGTGTLGADGIDAPGSWIGNTAQHHVATAHGASLADAELALPAGLLREPHDSLYPPVWGPDLKMRPEAKAAFLGRAYDAFSGIDVHGKLRFAVIGSGASYNWDEAGDLDIQVWCSDPDLVPALRKRIIPVNNPTCAELGLGETALMEVQFYVKPGGGTDEENLAGKPYTCYDMNTDTWVLEPWPITPEFYAAAFANIEAEAELVAQEVSANLAEFHRAERAAAYWARFPEHAESHAAALLAYKAAHEAVRAQFLHIFGARAEAYTPQGQGIYDERDTLVKILEVWGLWDDLKRVGQARFGRLTKAAYAYGDQDVVRWFDTPAEAQQHIQLTRAAATARAYRGLSLGHGPAPTSDAEVMARLRGIPEADRAMAEANDWPIYGQHWTTDAEKAREFALRLASNVPAYNMSRSNPGIHTWGVVLEAILNDTPRPGYDAEHYGESEVRPTRSQVVSVAVHVHELQPTETLRERGINRMATDTWVRSFVLPEETWRRASRSRTVSKVALEVDHRSFKVLLIDGRVVNVKRIERDGDQMWVVTTLDERIPSERILTVNPQRVASVDDYGGAHQPGQAAPLTDLTEAMPADVYEHPERYTGFTDRATLSETVRAINAARGNPSARVTIYRSAPPGVTTIDTGNWVSLSKAYATQHGLDAYDPEQDWPVYAAEVEARHVWFAGDDLMEFGYWGPPINVRTAGLQPRRGGYLAKVASAVEYEVTGPDSFGDFDVVARVGGVAVGRLQGGKYNAVSRIFVDPGYRRRGIATEMYRRLEQAAGGMTMRRPDEFSDSGAAWYSQVGDKEVYPTWGTEPDWSGWLKLAGAKVASVVTSWDFGGDSVGRGEYAGWVVAYVDGRPAGRFDYTIWEEEPDVLFIRNVEVVPEFRGRGIAQEMVDYVIAEQWTDWGKPAPKVDPGYLTDDGAKWWPKAKGRWRTAMPVPDFKGTDRNHTARHATANIRHEDSAPLDYGARAERLAIYEDGFVGTHSYTRDIPGLVAFLDYIPWGGRIYIKYAFVDPARRGRGLARRLIERLYATTSGDIDWGEVHDPGMGRLWQEFKQSHPSRGNKGKNFYRQAASSRRVPLTRGPGDLMDEVDQEGGGWGHEASRFDRAGGAGDRRLAGVRAGRGSPLGAGRGVPARAWRGRRRVAVRDRTLGVRAQARKDFRALDAVDRRAVRRALKRYARGEQPAHALTGPLRGYVAIEVGSRLRVFVREDGMHSEVLGVGRHENFYAEMRRRLGSGGLRFETTVLDYERGLEVRAVTPAGVVAGAVRFHQKGDGALLVTRIWTAPSWRGKEVYKAIWEHLDSLGYEVDHATPTGQDLLTARLASGSTSPCASLRSSPGFGTQPRRGGYIARGLSIRPPAA